MIVSFADVQTSDSRRMADQAVRRIEAVARRKLRQLQIADAWPTSACSWHRSRRSREAERVSTVSVSMISTRRLLPLDGRGR